MIDATANSLEVLKLHLNNRSKSRFDGNKNRTFFFSRNENHMLRVNDDRSLSLLAG